MNLKNTGHIQTERTHAFRVALIKGFILLAAVTASANDTKSQGIFEKQVSPILDKHCMDCHDADTKKGGFNMAALSRDLDDPHTVNRWVRIYDLVAAGEMPAKKSYALDAATRARFLKMVAEKLAAPDKRIATPTPRMLNNLEIQNSLSDIFGIELDYNPYLPENIKDHGYDTQSSTLKMSDTFIVGHMRYVDDYLALLVEPPPVVTISADSDHEILDSAIIVVKKRVANDGHYRLTFDVTRKGSKSGLELFVKPGYAKLGRGSSVQNMYTRRFTNMKNTDNWQPELFEMGSKAAKKTVTTDRYLLKGETFQIFTADGKRPRKSKRDDAPAEATQAGFVLNNIKVVGPIYSGRGQIPDTKEKANAYLQELLPRIHRRHLSVEEAGRVNKIVDTSKDAALKATVVSILRKALLSPDFLFNRKLENVNYHIATRMSLFLWRSCPDDRLLDDARAGKLMDSKVRAAHVKRMLDDDRAQRFYVDFLDQWFSLDRFYTDPFPTKINTEFYDRPELLMYSMLEQAHLFFQRVMKENRSALDIIDSDWTYLNQRLAGLYDLQKPSVAGQELRVVNLPPGSRRGGLLNQGAIMRTTSIVDETSPVKRGAWIADKMMGIYLPPPPDDVPNFVPDTTAAKSLKEQFVLHRKMTQCAGCHNKFDPIGFPFESYDTVGKFRTNYYPAYTVEKSKVKSKSKKPGAPIDLNGFPYMDTRIGTVEDLKNYIVANPADTFVKAFLEQLIIFSMGREVRFYDRQYIAAITKRTQPGNYRARALLTELIASDLFILH